LIDTCTGELLEIYRKAGLLDRTLVAIVSDHGFLPIHQTFHVGVALRKAGLIRYQSEADKQASDYDAAPWVAGGSCAIVLKDPNDKQTLGRARQALAPYVGEGKPIRRMLERDEIARLNSNPQAALMLDAGDGYTFDSRATGEMISETKNLNGMHGQMPD